MVSFSLSFAFEMLFSSKVDTNKSHEIIGMLFARINPPEFRMPFEKEKKKKTGVTTAFLATRRPKIIKYPVLSGTVRRPCKTSVVIVSKAPPTGCGGRT